MEDTSAIFLKRGFVEIDEQDYEKRKNEVSAHCTVSPSTYCTKVCKSAHANYANSAEAWDAFLDIEGGSVQY